MFELLKDLIKIWASNLYKNNCDSCDYVFLILFNYCKNHLRETSFNHLKTFYRKKNNKLYQIKPKIKHNFRCLIIAKLFWKLLQFLLLTFLPQIPIVCPDYMVPETSVKDKYWSIYTIQKCDETQK